MADRMHFGGENDRTTPVSKTNPMPVQMYSSGQESFISQFGDQYVSIKNPDVMVQFQYNLSSFDVDSVVSGTGSVAQADAQGEAHAGAGVGKANLFSHDVVRYRPGHESFAFFTARFTTPEANTTQAAGLFDDDHGFAIGYNGTQFACFLRNGGTTDWGAATPLDLLDGSKGFTLDPTKLNVFRITYGWLGIAPIVFWIDAGYLLGWIPFAYIDLINSQAVPSIANPHLKVSYEVERTSGTGADIIVAGSSWLGGSSADSASHAIGARGFAFDNSKTIVGGVLTNIFTIKAATTFQSLESHIRIDPLFLAASADGTKPAEILLYKNATLGGTPAYTDIDANNSTVSADVAGTTVSGGTFAMSLELGKTDSTSEKLRDLNFHLHPGDTLTMAALSVNASDIGANMRWEELF